MFTLLAVVLVSVALMVVGSSKTECYIQKRIVKAVKTRWVELNERETITFADVVAGIFHSNGIKVDYKVDKNRIRFTVLPEGFNADSFITAWNELSALPYGIKLVELKIDNSEFYFTLKPFKEEL